MEWRMVVSYRLASLEGRVNFYEEAVTSYDSATTVWSCMALSTVYSSSTG
jgi:hypothetical protein